MFGPDDEHSNIHFSRPSRTHPTLPSKSGQIFSMFSSKFSRIFFLNKIRFFKLFEIHAKKMKQIWGKHFYFSEFVENNIHLKTFRIIWDQKPNLAIFGGRCGSASRSLELSLPVMVSDKD